MCCPEGFWRKGNVDIVCERFGIPCVEDFEQGTPDRLVELQPGFAILLPLVSDFDGRLLLLSARVTQPGGKAALLMQSEADVKAGSISSANRLCRLKKNAGK